MTPWRLSGGIFPKRVRDSNLQILVDEVACRSENDRAYERKRWAEKMKTLKYRTDPFSDSLGGEKDKQEYAKPELQVIEIATHEILGGSDEPAPPGGGDDPFG